MVREIITINIGQAGIQLGQSIWHQYCAEHGIDSKGYIKKDFVDDNTSDKSIKKVNSMSDHRFSGNIGCFFDESDSGAYVPRNLSVDLEPNVIDDVKASDIGELFWSEYLLHGYEDAANNFARGRFTVGREIIEKVNRAIKKLVEKCDSLQGFIINHSVGGGTGSGLGTLMLDNLNTNRSYKKKSKLGFEIYPSKTLSNCVVEPYNALLATEGIIKYIDISFLMDNEALYSIYKKNLNVLHPSYENINHLISKAISSLTASIRFSGELNLDMEDLKTNLIPFPRLKFMTTSLAPILTQYKMKTFNCDARTLTDLCFNESSFFVQIPDFDNEDDQYVCSLLMFRGNIVSKEASAATEWVKNNKKCSFVDWSPCGFKICLNEMPPACAIATPLNDKNDSDDSKDDEKSDSSMSNKNKSTNNGNRRNKKNNKNYIDGVKIRGNSNGSDIGYCRSNAVMIGNNMGISRVFANVLCKKFDLMYSQRAYVHWYVSEGMEEGDFAEAREELEMLEKDYLDMMAMGMDDDDDSDDSDNSDDDDDL